MTQPMGTVQYPKPGQGAPVHSQDIYDNEAWNLQLLETFTSLQEDPS